MNEKLLHCFGGIAPVSRHFARRRIGESLENIARHAGDVIVAAVMLRAPMYAIEPAEKTAPPARDLGLQYIVTTLGSVR